MKKTENVNEFFDTNAEDYEEKHYANNVRSFMTVRQVRVLELIDGLCLPQGAKVLDAGCGPGFLLKELSRRGFQIYGMDASEGMLKRARMRLSALNSSFPASLELGNIEQLPYCDNSFDVICSNGVIEYLESDATMLKEMMRVMRPGGYLILPVTNFWSPINYLDFLFEYMKRKKRMLVCLNALLRQVGYRPLLPRHFSVRRHRPASLKKSLDRAGFLLQKSLYFYFLPWPRPFDKIFPSSSAFLGERMERFGSTCLGLIAEGYLTLSKKP